MADKSSDIIMVTFSVRVYQLLLKAYPTKFRQEYGLEMAQVFWDCCLRAVRQGGRNGMARLWVRTLLDFMHSVLEQHRRQENDMTKSKLVKLSGITLMVGGFLLITATWGSHSFWRFAWSLGLRGNLVHPVLSWLGLIVMAVGLLVLHRQSFPNQISTGRLVRQLG